MAASFQIGTSRVAENLIFHDMDRRSTIDLSLTRHEQVIVHFKYVDCGGCRLIGWDPGDILAFIRLFRPKLRRSGLNPTQCLLAKRLPPIKN